MVRAAAAETRSRETNDPTAKQGSVPCPSRYDSVALAGRVLIGVLFLMSGLSKLAAPAATQGYIASVGLPAPVVAYAVAVAVEVLGSSLLIAGLRTRFVAAGMAVFTLATALAFHKNFADQNQMIHFMKNIAIMGGLLQVVAFGGGKFSVDRPAGPPLRRRPTPPCSRPSNPRASGGGRRWPDARRPPSSTPRPTMSAAIALEHTPARQVIYRTRGRTHGSITRLMSPGDLGEILKPFVFLDLFDNQGERFPTFGLHPHSGLATLTYVAEGSVSYEDTNGATGILRAGGVEWMRAGKGVWHSGGAGDPAAPAASSSGSRCRRTWNSATPKASTKAPRTFPGGAGPRAAGQLRRRDQRDRRRPSPINYLAVTLKAGETWRYQPPAGHTVLWAAMGKGVVEASAETLEHGEIVVFEAGEEPVEFKARTDTEFMLGSAAPHPHDLVLGYYSVHTSAEALRIGEARIEE